MSPSAVIPEFDAFLQGGGEMGLRIAAHDWHASPLGLPTQWPQSLRTTLSIMLASRSPMCLAWGPELTLFYNDGYRPILGDKDPTALGGALREVWSDVWADIEPLVDTAMRGAATWSENMYLQMHRYGHPEDTWWTFSYTPVRDETGAVAGMLNITGETTATVLSTQRLSEERLRLARMFEQAPSFMALLHGPEHRIEFANSAYQRLIGHRDVIGKTMAEALPDAAAQGYITLLDEVYATGRVFAADGARYDAQPEPGGRVYERFVDFVFQPIADEAGVIVGIFVEGVDVTSRSLADQALRQSESRLRELNANLERQVADRAHDRSRTWQLTPDLLAVVNADGFFERTNPAWERVLGWNEHDLATYPYSHFLHPDDLAASVKAFASVVEGQPLLMFENRYRTRSGAYRTLSWTATPEHGKLYCTARDVTREHAAAQALAASQARLRTLFESSYQLQGLCALDGTLIDANRTALEVIERDYDDVVGRPFWDTPWFSATPGMGDAVRAAFVRAAAGDSVRTEMSINVPLGRRAFDFSIRPMRDADGRVIAVAPEAIDITERRNAEEALRQSQKLEAMGQLTGGVAHDFNNLLTPIVVALEVAGDAAAPPERRQRMLGAARQSADRAATLVQRLLAFARKQPLQTADVDIGQLLRGMADLIASTCEPRVRVTLEIEPDLAGAVADANQLELAILNLSVNARDAMPAGGTLTIAARNAHNPRSARGDAAAGGAPDDLASGRYVLLTVADTGEGMDEATRLRAIEPFFSTKGVGKGTGLGLSMVHGLASQLGGRLAIDSAPGAGTTIALWLPAAARTQVSTSFDEATDVTTDGKRQGVALVVDDEEMVRMCTADVLVDMGYHVVEAASGADALREMDAGLQPDVLVTDQLMPGMTGAELAQAVQTRCPSVAIVVVSGYTALDGLDPGLVLLSKPFRQRDLMASVQAAQALKA